MTIVDANILVYSHNTAAVQHETSVRWLEKAIESEEFIGIPWQSVMAFLRITTTPGVMPRPLPMAEASLIIESWLSDPQFVIPEPGRRFWSILKKVGEDCGTRGRGWSDAYLAALAIENGASFATFDRDFRKFKGLKLVEL